MQAPLLVGRGIGKSFGGVQVLRDVSITLMPGEVLALMGENGAGKSTLVKILSGIHRQDAGEIFIDGQPVVFNGVRDAERAGIAMIHQELNLVPELSVAENIFLGREPLRGGIVVNGRAIARQTRQLLNRLGLRLDPDAKLRTLRVGEQQVVEIAKALALDARLLIMDEPTSALSPAETSRLLETIAKLAASGIAIIYISHRLDEIMQLANRIVVLRDGQHVLTSPIGEIDRARLIRAMVGRDLAHEPERTASRPGALVLRVRDLSLRLPDSGGGWRTLLHGVSFDLHAGEILGIGGLLGAGRTEILETIFGATRGERSGKIWIDGYEHDILDPARAKRLGLALVTEDRKATGLHLRNSINDNVALPSLSRLATFGLRQWQRERRLARGLVERLRIRCQGLEEDVLRLSGGNQQKVAIGRWLATGPRILLLDEPTRGIDVGAKAEIHALIRDLAAKGMAILLVSSELPELLRLADRILVMCEGHQMGLLARDEASEEAFMEMATPRAAAAMPDHPSQARP